MFVLIFWCLTSAASGKALWGIEGNASIRVCSPADISAGPPDFNRSDCYTTRLRDLDPQHRHLWLQLRFDRPQHWYAMKPPHGVYLLGKFASRVYLNGRLLGENGIPAADDTEVPGDMDAVFYTPQELISDHHNTLEIALSGHHSLVTLGQPIHFIGLGEYRNPRQLIQKYSGFGRVLAGAFVLGWLYFLIIGLGTHGKRQHLWFAAMSLIAALQLTAEMSRGLLSYTYPWHDVRLITVTTLSLLFGMLLLGYISRKTHPRHAAHWIYAGLIVTLLAIALLPGFDTKTTAGIFFPLLISLLQLLLAWLRQRDLSLLMWFGVQLTVTVTIVITAASFHEIVHFVIIALLLVYLFIEQALGYRKHQARQQQDQHLIAKLEHRLTQSVKAHIPTKLEVSTAGKIELIQIDNIAYCKAAGDYAEVYLTDGTEKLYSGSLKQLEGTLPNTFLRVHRSYLVNLNKVVILTGKTSREALSNRLQLRGDYTVPVSRRLMPTVRGSLKHIPC